MQGIYNVQESTELGDALKQLNSDLVADGTKMSDIDMRARLHPVEISSLLAIDSLVAWRFLPQEALMLTRQKKRLSVSHRGLGRKEIVQVVGNRQDHEEKTNGLIGKMKGFMGMGGQQQ